MKRIIILIFLATSLFGQKQSLYSNYPGLVFREVFNDEQSTRANGGVPTSVTYSQGSGVFNGSSSYVDYGTNGSWNTTTQTTIRLKVYLTANNKILMAKGANNSGGFYVYIDATNKIKIEFGSSNNNNIQRTTVSAISLNQWLNISIVHNSTSLDLYLNGSLASVTNGSSGTFTGNIQTSGKNLLVGKYSSAGYEMTGSIDFVEIYNRALTSSEIANLYNNTWNRDLDVKPLISFDSRSGIIKDLTGKTITNTSTTIKRNGSIWSADFNGSTSKLDYGNINALTGDITICTWVKIRGVGGNSLGRILDNGATVFYGNSPSYFTMGSANSASGSYIKNKWIYLVVTRTSAGVTNYYIGDYKTAPALSGTANQSGGTPSAGSNIIIGNNSAQTRGWDGLIPRLRVYQSILTLNQITQLWQSTANNYVGD